MWLFTTHPYPDILNTVQSWWSLIKSYITSQADREAARLLRPGWPYLGCTGYHLHSTSFPKSPVGISWGDYWHLPWFRNYILYICKGFFTEAAILFWNCFQSTLGSLIQENLLSSVHNGFWFTYRRLMETVN